VELSHDNIQPMPNIGEGTENRFVKGIVTSDDKTLRVLDINNIGDSMAQACEIA
jgi:chemotaxis signal transduction protein